MFAALCSEEFDDFNRNLFLGYQELTVNFLKSFQYCSKTDLRILTVSKFFDD